VRPKNFLQKNLNYQLTSEIIIKLDRLHNISQALLGKIGAKAQKWMQYKLKKENNRR
jgi:hypothetical protein